MFSFFFFQDKPFTEQLYQKIPSYSPATATPIFTTLKLNLSTSTKMPTALSSSTKKEAHKVIDECSPNPCANYATCITFTNGKFYKCFCQQDYSGFYCQNGRMWITIGIMSILSVS